MYINVFLTVAGVYLLKELTIKICWFSLLCCQYKFSYSLAGYLLIAYRMARDSVKEDISECLWNFMLDTTNRPSELLA